MDKKVKLSIIFVCTGNTCRSPMAEFLFKDYLKDLKRGGDFAVSSAGLVPEKGSIISANANAALDYLGIKHNSARKAKTFTVQMSLEADLIVAMSAYHAERCDSDNAVSFEQLIGRPIPDPYGGTLRDYLDCASAMQSAFDAIFAIAEERLNKKRAAGGI